jgi:hypothetical protein
MRLYAGTRLGRVLSHPVYAGISGRVQLPVWRSSSHLLDLLRGRSRPSPPAAPLAPSQNPNKKTLRGPGAPKASGPLFFFTTHAVASRSAIARLRREEFRRRVL